VDQDVLATMWYCACELDHPHIDTDGDYKDLVHYKISGPVPHMGVELWLERTGSRTGNSCLPSAEAPEMQHNKVS
jgi:hypothetical protein